MFVSIWIILWSLIDVSVMIINLCGELVIISEKHIKYVIFSRWLLYILLHASIVPVQIAERHLLEPDFQVFSYEFSFSFRVLVHTHFLISSEQSSLKLNFKLG